MKRVVVATGILSLLAASVLVGILRRPVLHNEAQVALEHPVPTPSPAAAPSQIIWPPIIWPPDRSPEAAFYECLRQGRPKERHQRWSDCIDAWHREFPGAPLPRGSTIPLRSSTG